MSDNICVFESVSNQLFSVLIEMSPFNKTPGPEPCVKMSGFVGNSYSTACILCLSIVEWKVREISIDVLYSGIWHAWTMHSVVVPSARMVVIFFLSLILAALHKCRS